LDKITDKFEFEEQKMAIPHWASNLEQLSFTDNNPSLVTFDNYQPYVNDEYRAYAPIPSELSLSLVNYCE
jgi:hypothetical protein